MRRLLFFIISFGLWLLMATSVVAVDNTELLPTFAANNNQIHEASARKREKISLKTKMKDIYKSKEKVELIVFNNDEAAVEVKLKDLNGEVVSASINQSTVGGVTTIDVDSPTQFVPGKYELEVKDVTGAVVSQDFLWGVLAINPNKAVYNPGEKADLSMAVLDEKGDMVCDANVKLIINNEKLKIKSELSTENGKITVNPECKTHGTGSKPDYGATYQLGGEGEYTLELTAITKNGTYSISDRVEVKNKVDFEVERISATRIYPVNRYVMKINLKANKSFEGEVYEVVPFSFEVTSSGGVPFRVVVDGESKKIVWKVNLNQGSVISLSYGYKAPEISPQFYLIGGLWMANSTDLVYTEGRQWQVAADALSVAQIRQEINIIDGAVTVGGTDAALINIDTTKYNGATYYFEVVASQGAGTTLTVNLSTGNTQSVGIGITNGASIVRVRKAFVPETGSFDYRLNVVTGSTFSIQAARVIVLQSATNITATETQIELGNEEIGLTMATSDSIPVYQNVGTSVAATTGTATPTWPTHQTNDVALLFVETIGESAAVLSTPNGFAAVSGSSKSVGTGTSGTTLSVFWARATSGAMSAPVVSAAGDHILAVIVTYRNVVESGDPWDVSVGTTKAAVSTTTTFGSVTTTVDNALVVMAASRHNDSNAIAWGVVTNSNLDSISERVDGGTTSGNGGGILVADGIKAAAGSTGSATSVVTSSINAQMTIALKGKVYSPGLTIKLQEDDGSFGGWSDKVTILNAGITTATAVHSRSASFVPTTGRNYRIVSYLNNSDGHSYDIYNAKIIVDQTSATLIDKLEPQYLLLNTKSTTTGSALGYQQLWSSSEWQRAVIVYKHAQDAVGAGANSKLRDVAASSDVVNSSITGENQTVGSGMTMPTSGDEFDTWLVNAGTEVDASRILVQVTLNAYGVDPSGYSFQRKTWRDGSRYWRSYNDTTNSRIVFEYSSDGNSWTENTSARISVNTSDYSVEADGSYVFVVYTGSNDIKGRAGTSYPGTGFGWGSEQVVFNGSGVTDDYSYPTITRDSSGYVWSAARYTGSGVYFLKAMKETTATNDLPEDANDTSDSLVDSGNTDSNIYGVMVPRTSQNMYITMALGSTIAGCKWVNGSSAWQNSAGDSCTDNVGTLNNGLVGYWKMEEVGGSARADSSGYGNNMDESVGVTLPRVTGKFGYGADFEASNLNYLSIPDQPEFGLTDFTMSAWIKEESSNVFGLIMGYGEGGDWSYNMTTWESNAITANLDQDGFAGGGVTPLSNAIMTASTWTLVTITYDGSTVRLYKDGTEQTSGDFPLSSSIALHDSTGSFYLGYFQNQSGYFDGVMDDVRLYNRAIGSSEVSQLYNYVPSGASYDVVDTGAGGVVSTFSSVGDSTGNVHLVYVGVGGSVAYREYTSAWQTPVVLDSNAGNEYTSISLNATNSDVYAFWIRNSHIYYKKGVSTYTSGNWDTNPTDWKSTGSNVFLTTNYSGSDMIFGEWYDGSSIRWDKLSFGGSIPVPELRQLLRHGMWFVNGSKQKFTF